MSYACRSATLLRGVSPVAVTLALAAGALLSGCHPAQSPADALAPPPDALAPVATTAPLVLAPNAQSLPNAPPPLLRRVSTLSEGYAFADRAYAMSDAFGDSPPDYTYDEDGVRPWVWRGSDDCERVVEAVPGGERTYYYEPGSDTPFFIQDPDQGYGFENGALVVVYDRSGHELADAQAQQQLELAGRYLARARTLYDASRRDQRVAVAQENWIARRDQLEAQRHAWRQEQQQDPDWRAYHVQFGPAEQAHFAPERQQRLRWSAQIDQSMNDPARAQRELREARVAAGVVPATNLQPPAGRGPPTPGATTFAQGGPQGQPPAVQRPVLAARQDLEHQRALAHQQQTLAQQQAQSEAARLVELRAAASTAEQKRAQSLAQAQAARQAEQHMIAQQHTALQAQARSQALAQQQSAVRQSQVFARRRTMAQAQGRAATVTMQHAPARQALSAEASAHFAAAHAVAKPAAVAPIGHEVKPGPDKREVKPGQDTGRPS